MKAAIETLGCKVNQYESALLANALREGGYTMVDPADDADVYIVNSCTVTAAADQKTRKLVRKCKRAHPDAAVVLTGCMTQAFPEDADALPEADIVLGNRNNGMLLELLDTYHKFGKRIVKVQQHENGETFAPCAVQSFDERTRAIVKIEDGCNRFCSYCIIPYARGRVRSKPLEDLRREVETLAANGYREVVLVGINLSAFGLDSGHTLADAVETACGVEGIERVRLGSLEPDHMTDELLERLSKQPKLCPQFHISLQSGCERTLKAMNRHYTADEFRRLCRKLRAQFPDCTLTTDVMVGFCGETRQDFEESLSFVEEIGFEKLHVFPYSVRSGTKAASMPDQVPQREKHARAAEMLVLGERMRTAFFRSLVGKKERVLLESTRKNGNMFGYTANYTPVIVKGTAPVGSFVDVVIEEIGQEEVIASPVE